MSEAIEIVKNFYETLSRGDGPAALGLLHPSLSWTEAEGFPYYSGTWHSPEEVAEKLLKPLSRDWDDFKVVADDFIATGNRVVSLGVYSGSNKLTKKAMRARFAHVWQVVNDKLARFDMYTDTYLVRQAME